MKILQRIGLFLLFLACGLLVFVVFSHYFPIFERTTDIVGRIVVAIGFLTAALVAYRNERFNKYWLIPFAFFAALAAISIDYYLGLSKWIYPALGTIEKSPVGYAVDKLESSLLGIVVILALNRLAGQSMDSLYIRRGNLRLGLIVGFIAFAVMIATVIPVTEMFFKGQNLSWARSLPWTPWVLIMVFSNAAYEELVFRGMFIGRLEPFFGKFAINVVTTIPFVLNHAGNTYMSDAFIFFVLQLLPLSLVWCWLMQKTNSIWGSILLHAAMDIPVFVGIFSGL
jgi:membrane protease YdiL (CAAX protease family)